MRNFFYVFVYNFIAIYTEKEISINRMGGWMNRIRVLRNVVLQLQ